MWIMQIMNIENLTNIEIPVYMKFTNIQIPIYLKFTRICLDLNRMYLLLILEKKFPFIDITYTIEEQKYFLMNI